MNTQGGSRSCTESPLAPPAADRFLMLSVLSGTAPTLRRYRPIDRAATPLFNTISQI